MTLVCALVVILTSGVREAQAQADALARFMLTPSERNWLRDHPNIRLAIDTGWAPFEFVDSDGRYDGMAAEYIRLVEKRLGIDLQIDTKRSWSEMVEAVKNHDLDAFSLVVRTPKRENYLNFTKPYISFPMIIVALDTEPYIDGVSALRNLTVSVVENYASHELLVQNHPELMLRPAKNAQEGLEAVSNGQAHAFIGNLAVASQVIRDSGITNLKISGQTPYRFELSMAARKDWPELIPILQKGLDSITQAERDAIYNRWIRVKYRKDVDYRLLLALLSVGILILGTILIWNRKLQKEIHRRHATEALLDHERQRLKEIIWSANVGTWEWNLQTGAMEFNERWAEIVGHSLSDLETFEPDPWTYLTHPDDLQKSDEQMDASFAQTNEHYECEVRMRHKAGHWIWVRDRGKVVEWTQDGDPVRISGTQSDITATKEQQRQLEHLAHFDALTGLPNRVLLADRLQSAMARTQRPNNQLAVAYIDLDGFKSVNDTYGHDVGDDLLVALAERMQGSLRDMDTLSRLGGDEFVAVLCDLDSRKSCMSILENFLQDVAAPLTVNGLNLNVSASIGIAFYPQSGPQSGGVEADQLMRQADQAMYQAKLAGKNRYQVFGESPSEVRQDKNDDLSPVQRALNDRQFELYYQPQLNIQSGEILGFRARIFHRKQGREIAPKTLQQSAKDHGFAIDLAKWAIENASLQAAIWRKTERDLPVRLDITALNVQATDVVGFVDQQASKLPEVFPHFLIIEVSEPHDQNQSLQVTRHVGDNCGLDLRLTQEGFGSAYSALQSMEHQPVKRLVLDQNLTQALTDMADASQTLGSVTGLAKIHGIEVLAEGVSSMEQRGALLEIHCNLAEGPAIVQPLQSSDVASWIEGWNHEVQWVASSRTEDTRSANQ